MTLIYGRLEDEERYSFLDDKIKRCLRFARETNLAEFTPGTHTIEGEEVFVNIVEYQTCPQEERIWEAHKDYIDLHMVLRGEERMHLNATARMEQGDYVPEEDFLPLKGTLACEAVLGPGDFLLCYPEDGHKTAVWDGKTPADIKKAIFKIRLGCGEPPRS